MAEVSLPTPRELSAIQGIPSIVRVFKDRLDPFLRAAEVVETLEVKEEPKPAVEVYKKTKELIDRGHKLKAKIDQRSKNLTTSTPIKEGSKLWQAMFRTFGKGSDTITYPQYVQALEMHRGLEEELHARN